MEFKTIFLEIQPLCVNIAKKPELKNIQSLNKYLENVIKIEEDSNESVSVLNDLKEYVAFPLVLALKKQDFNYKGSDDLLENILNCLEKIFANCLSLDWNFFSDVFLLLFLRITSSQNPQIVANIREEIKISALQNVIYLCKAFPSEHWNKLLSEAFRPQLGHAIYICLQIAEKEKHRLLKITALNVIMELGLKSHSSQFDADLTKKLGFTFANFLPGIAMATTRIATSGEIQGHKVTVAALHCWQYFVCAVMRDEFLLGIVGDFDVPRSILALQKMMLTEEKVNLESIASLSEQKSFVASSNRSSEQDSVSKLKNVIIDYDWIEATGKRLSLLVKSLVALVSHAHWRVRETLVACCESLFQHCLRSMNACVVFCLEALVTLRSDAESDVCERAIDALHLLQRGFDPQDEGRLLRLLEERIFALASRLPTTVKTQDDVKVLSSVRQLHGSLEVLGSRVQALVRLPSHLDRLLRAILVVLTFDYSDSDLLLEKTLSDDPFEVMEVKPRLGSTFRYFRSDSILYSIGACCELIGRHGDLILVVDYCLELFNQSSFHRNESLLLLHLILKGVVSESEETVNFSPEEREKMVDGILGVLLSQNIFETPLSVGRPETSIGPREEMSFSSLVSFHSFKPSISVDAAKRNIILVSNALHLTGTCASFLGKGFDVFLNRVLCSLMEKAGESYIIVAFSALDALGKVATACGHTSVSDLIEDSVPFFWFTLSQKLKRLPDYPSSPQVLKVALRCQRGEVKAFVEELVEDVLDTLDKFHTKSPLPLLTVLYSFVDTIVKAKEKKGEVEQKDAQVSEDKENLPEQGFLRVYLEEIHRKEIEIELEVEQEMKKTREEGEKEMSLSAEEGFRNLWQQKEKALSEDQQEMGFQEEKKKVPKQIELVVQIAERCAFLLFTQDRKCQLVVLQIICCCCLIFREWEDEKLPCFHKIWKPLVLRLKGKDFVVMLKSLETCVLMVQESGDFLRKRFLKEVFPSLLFFLESQASTSIGKTRNSGYYLTPAFKTQRHVLENVPCLLQGLKLDVVELGDLLDVVMPYLDERQPAILNQLAFEALKSIKEFHPDLVWLAIAFSQEPVRMKPPSPLLKPVIINGVMRSHLSKKVLQLYEELC